MPPRSPARYGWQPVLAALEAEVANGLPGSQAIQAKMADVLLAQVLRSWLIGADRAGLRIDGLLADPPTAGALEALRDRYVEHWTIDRLAAHVALSRSALAARFREHVGDSPMHYLTRIRVGQAAGYLATTRLTLSEIAHLTGYGSDAALSKAFRRELGQTPGAYRAASSHPTGNHTHRGLSRGLGRPVDEDCREGRPATRDQRIPGGR